MAWFYLVLLIGLSTCPSFGLAEKKVLLSSVQTLTLYSDKFTTGRRSSPIPQLRCIDGKSSCTNIPSAVQCYSKGSDGIDVQWKCEAQLPKNVQFDSLQVQCEGYDYPDDPYVLAGSCGLTYSLKPAGSRSSSGSSHQHHHHHHSASQSQPGKGDNVGEGVSPFLVVGGFLVVALAVYFLCLAPDAGRRRPVRASPSAPSYDEDAPPPPYTPGDAGSGAGSPQYGFRPEYTAPGGAKYTSQPGASQQQQQYMGGNAAGGGPGFWTGAGLGGVAGYLFGSRGNADSGAQYRSRDDDYRQGSPGGFAAGRDASYSSSSSAASEEPVTRTGYATTRRR